MGNRNVITNRPIRALAWAAALLASTFAHLLPAHADEFGRAGDFTILKEAHAPGHCRAIMIDRRHQAEFGQFFAIALDDAGWQLWSDVRVYHPQVTSIIVDGRHFNVQFEQIEETSVAPVGRNVIDAIARGSRLNLNRDPDGPQYTLRGSARAIEMLEACVRGGGNRGARASAPPPVEDGVYWERMSGGAIDGRAPSSGRDTNGAPLYVCSAEFNGVNQPGKIRHGFRGCNFGYGGQELTSGTYMVLLGRPKWARASNGQVPANAVQAGSELNGSPLFVCRTQYEGSMQLGKVRPGFRGCNFGYGGGELTGNPYEVMY